MSAEKMSDAPTVPIGSLRASPSVPTERSDGLVLVPREPTMAMLQGACEKHTPGQPMSEGQRECPGFIRRRRIWSEMINAFEASQPGIGAADEPKTSPMIAATQQPALNPQDIEDAISDAIGDSMDMDWTYRDGAKSIMRAFEREGWEVVPLNRSAERVRKSGENEQVAALSATQQPAGEGERTLKGISLDGRQGEPAGMMTVTAHMSDGTDVVLIRDNGNVISHWKNTSGLYVASAGEPLAAICQSIADDYQTSEAHHPNHVLIRKDHFDAMIAATQQATG